LPERFASLLAPDSHWQIAAVRRSGAFLQQADLVSDEELIEQISGREAFNATSYDRCATPEIVPSWREFRRELDHFLTNVALWQAGLRWWLDLAQAEEVGHVLVQVFSPHNVPRVFVEGAEHGDVLKRLPALGATTHLDRGGARGAMGASTDCCIGELLWDGSTAVRPTEAFEETYEDPMIWALFQNPGAEARFLELLGLRYALFEKGPEGQRTLLVRDGDTFRRREHDDLDFAGKGIRLIWNGVVRIDDFIDQRATEVQQLVQYLLRHWIARIG